MKWKVISLAAIAERDETWRQAGIALWPERFDVPALEEIKRADAVVWECTPAESPVLMADWTSKPIADVRVGDAVMGFLTGSGLGGKSTLTESRLVPAVVEATSVRLGEVQSIRMASGRTVRCTASHKWWTPKGKSTEQKLRPQYRPAKVGRTLRLIDDLDGTVSDRHAALWVYLAGLVDGEGHVARGVLTIAQSRQANPDVFDQIQAVLDELGLKYVITTNRHSNCEIFVIHDNRRIYQRLINTGLCGKAERMRRIMRESSCKFVRLRDKVEEIVLEGAEPVYGLTTTTGNYVVWGYASSNSSYQQRPTVGGGNWFDPRWLQLYKEIKLATMNIYIIVDPALGKTKKSDFTCIFVIGAGQDRNYYWIECIRERLDPAERANRIFSLHRKYRPLHVAYEEYGMQSDVSHLQEKMERENYRFPVTVLGRKGIWHNTSKPERIRTLIAVARIGRLWIPDPEWQGRDPQVRELVKHFIEREWGPYPSVDYDDMLDTLARINDPDMRMVFPTPMERLNPVEYLESGTTWMSA